MLCPKPGVAPVTWHTAAMVFLRNGYRGASAPPKITCRHAIRFSRNGAHKKPRERDNLSIVRDGARSGNAQEQFAQ